MKKPPIEFRADAISRLTNPKTWIPHYEQMIIMYESFLQTDPINGFWKWNDKLVKMREKLKRAKELA